MMTARMSRSEPFTAEAMAAPPPNWANWIWPDTMAAAAFVAPGMICTLTSRPLRAKMPVSAAIYSGQKPGEATLCATDSLVRPAPPDAAALPVGLAGALPVEATGAATPPHAQSSDANTTKANGLKVIRLHFALVAKQAPSFHCVIG